MIGQVGTVFLFEWKRLLTLTKDLVDRPGGVSCVYYHACAYRSPEN